jgi:hypothetical protein
METVPIPDLEDHVLGFGIRDGLAFFDSGEVTAFKNFTTWDLVMGKGGPGQSYHLFTFIDGSTIITANHQENLLDAEGKFAWDIIFTGKIVKGTGRFEGIKGSYSGTGKQLKPQKDELTGKTIYDCTLTYTVPLK